MTRSNLTLSCCFLESNHKGHLRCLLGSGGVKMCEMLLWDWMMRFGCFEVVYVPPVDIVVVVLQ